MNVYDFDGTIYKGDSTIDFYIYSIMKHLGLLRYLPIQLYGIILYKLKKNSKTQFKEKFYSFLRGVDDIDYLVDDFWKDNKKHLKSWYFERQKENDVVITASPYFLIKPLCDEIGIKYLIASKVDKYTGKYDGLNCRGKEKVNRLNKEMPALEIDDFFSDSISDYPIAKLAKRSYFVKNDKFIEWKVD